MDDRNMWHDSGHDSGWGRTQNRLRNQSSFFAARRHWCNNLLRQVCPPWADECRWSSLRQEATFHMPLAAQAATWHIAHSTCHMSHTTCHIPAQPLNHTSKAHTPQVLLCARPFHHTVHSYTPTWTTLPTHINLNYCTDTYWEQGEKWKMRRSSGTRYWHQGAVEQGTSKTETLNKEHWNRHL